MNFGIGVSLSFVSPSHSYKYLVLATEVSFLIAVSTYISLQRITIPEIESHPWFVKNLPIELMEGVGSWQCKDANNPSQSDEEVLSIIQQARNPSEEAPNAAGRPLMGSKSMDL